VSGTTVVNRIEVSGGFLEEPPLANYQIVWFEVSASPVPIDEIAVSGYHSGDAVRWVRANAGFDILNVTSPATNRPVPFGIDSVVVLNASGMSDVSAILMNQTASGAGLWDVLAAPVNVLVDGHGRPTNSGHRVSPVIRTGSPGDSPSVKWTFLYRKYGYANRYVNLIVGVSVEAVEPNLSLDNTDEMYVTVETIFIEVREDGAVAYVRQGEKEHRRTLSMLFEAFVVHPYVDAIKSIGVLSVITILVTLWGYYLVFFRDD
jgi:hypothetical protein